jgi:zinc transporter ZupT
VALFWVLPELAGQLRWLQAIAWVGLGFALLGVIDRYIYAVCPSCSHSHNHDGCETRLHGFAAPLLIAAALHGSLDGWSLSAAGDVHLSAPFLAGIAAHKLPEGLALGVIARASLGSRISAIALASLAQLATLAGGALESQFSAHLPVASIYALLALAGGSFLYLGAHAVHGELRRRGASPVLVPALTGVAGSSVLRLFVR